MLFRSVVLRVVYSILTELFPVSLVEHIPENSADFGEVFGLKLPVHLILAAEELGIGILEKDSKPEEKATDTTENTNSEDK